MTFYVEDGVFLLMIRENDKKKVFKNKIILKKI